MVVVVVVVKRSAVLGRELLQQRGYGTVPAAATIRRDHHCHRGEVGSRQQSTFRTMVGVLHSIALCSALSCIACEPEFRMYILIARPHSTATQ